MQTNAQNTVVLIFQHVQVFFTLLDGSANKGKSIVGFKLSEYESVLSHYLNTRIYDRTDRSRILGALNIQNLDACGLLSFIDDSRGLFALQRGLLQTIQCLDAKRIRELGQPDLDIIYAQVKSLYDYFIPKGGAYDRHDPEFQENLAALIDTLQDTLAKVDHNVRALDGSAKRLSEIVDSHDFNQLMVSDQVRNALTEINRITVRNIKPTLTFLNEKAMASDSSAMFLVRRIKESFENTTFHVELKNIQAIEMKLLSYSERVRMIRKSLYRYLEMDRKQRELYNRIEEKFNELHDKVVGKLDTKLKGRQVPADDPFFWPARMFWGLHNWSRSNISSSLIEFPYQRSRNHVEEYIRTKMEHAEAIAATRRQSSQRKESAKDVIARRKRVMQIKKAMETFDQQSAANDLYLAINSHLINSLPNYRLADIYDALAFTGKGWKKIPTLERKVIRHRGKALSYLAKKLEKENGVQRL